ncbi:MAG: hypothetical protein K0S32_2739 [Bacteroidetes bacterium]|nr:hypothetical protein [Bacteroidota bacterium]
MTLIVYIVCCLLAALVLPEPTQSFYLSDIYVGFGNKGETNDFTDYLDFMVFVTAAFFLFPVLFITNTVRAILRKFSNWRVNSFLLCVTILSLGITFFCLFFYKGLVAFFYGSMTIYPPLSALPQLDEMPEWMDYGIYLLWLFASIQVLILAITVSKIFNNRKNSRP